VVFEYSMEVFVDSRHVALCDLPFCVNRVASIRGIIVKKVTYTGVSTRQPIVSRETRRNSRRKKARKTRPPGGRERIADYVVTKHE
jgi:hypothetical protein